MTAEEAARNLEYAKKWHDLPADEAIDIAIKALEQPEPCEDAISREKIKKALQKVINHGFAAADGKHPVSAEKVLDYIIKMSSVAPKPKTGMWRKLSDGSYDCSKCDYKVDFSYDYCPMCGSLNSVIANFTDEYVRILHIPNYL